MGGSRYDIVTGEERPDLIEKGDAVFELVWPEFMLNGIVANELFPELPDTFPEYQFVLLEPATENIVALGNSLPLFYESEQLPDEGWDWAIRTGFKQNKCGVAPNTLCALSITIFPEYLGTGVSPFAVKAMLAVGSNKGYKELIAPVRPNAKSQYPLTPMDNYVRWERDDGLPFDPWMRVHARLGAETTNVCGKAFRIEGSVAQWEEWTGMAFLESGWYIVSGALVPVEIDVETDKGIYLEPNVWMVHNIR
jgi:hypothetical protein